MKTLIDIESYLIRLKQDQRNIPLIDRESYPEVTVVNNAFGILTHVSTPQQFITEMQNRSNQASHSDKAYLQELKNWYDNIIDYVQENSI